MIPEGYEESLAESLGFELNEFSNDKMPWLLEVDLLQFNFELGYVENSKLNKTELRPYARICVPLMSWDSISEVDGEVLKELASSKMWPFGLRIRNREGDEVSLYLEHFTFLTLSLDQDCDSFKTLIEMMRIAASSIQEQHL